MPTIANSSSIPPAVKPTASAVLLFCVSLVCGIGWPASEPTRVTWLLINRGSGAFAGRTLVTNSVFE